MRPAFRPEPEASAELEDAALWYERRRTGLGVEFRLVQRKAGRVAADPRKDLEMRAEEKRLLEPHRRQSTMNSLAPVLVRER